MPIDIDSDYERPGPSAAFELARAYLWAREDLVSSGYEQEIEWQTDTTLDAITESDFLREAAWVIASSGLREQCVRKFFPAIEEAHLRWVSAAAIVADAEGCRTRALRVFANTRKVDSILRLVRCVDDVGFMEVKHRLQDQGLLYIRQLPYMGPATSCHLAKSIGMDVAKPDRHLCRIAALAGYADVHRMCRDIAEIVDERVSVVDLVLWRFSNLHRDYLDLLLRYLLPPHDA